MRVQVTPESRVSVGVDVAVSRPTGVGQAVSRRSCGRLTRRHLVHERHRWDARWEDWFHATGREPIRVIYEEFVHTRAATVGRVLDALGVDPPQRDGEKGPMKRQADDLSRDWVTRFRDDAAAHQLTA